MESTATTAKKSESNRTFARIAGNGAALGFCAALFGTGEVVAILSVLRPHAWRSATVGETLLVAFRVLGGSVVPAVTCGTLMVAWASRKPWKTGHRPGLYALAFGLGGIAMEVGSRIFFILSGLSWATGFSVIGLQESLMLYPLAVLPALAAARASDLWSRDTSTQAVWQLRVVMVMNVGSVLLITIGFVVAALSRP